MPITIPGLGSGLDTNALVTSLVAVQQQPVTAMQTRQRSIDQASSSITSFSTRLASLATAARNLDTTAEFNATAATSSDATSVTASTVGGASLGTYDVRVTQLAREQRTQSNTFASSTTALGLSGSITLTVGSADPVTVAVSSGDTLANIAARISSSGARVSAGVIYDGTTYRMQVRGLDTGATNAISFAEDPAIQSALGLSDALNTYQSAQNAVFTVDNVAMTRSTNRVSDAAPGVTLTLLRTTTTPTTITVSSDTNALKTRVQGFISAFNDVVNTAHTMTGYGTQRATNPELASDRTVRGATERLSRILTSPVPGTTGRYTTLGSVGINLQNDGTLRLNETAFNAALTADPVSVARLFVTDTTSGATGVMSTFNTTVAELTTNVGAPLRTRSESLSARSRRIGTEISDMQRRIDTYTESLRAQFAAMETQAGRYNAMAGSIRSLVNSSGVVL